MTSKAEKIGAALAKAVKATTGITSADTRQHDVPHQYPRRAEG